jgi:hypothetical protein
MMCSPSESGCQNQDYFRVSSLIATNSLLVPTAPAVERTVFEALPRFAPECNAAFGDKEAGRACKSFDYQAEPGKQFGGD